MTLVIEFVIMFILLFVLAMLVIEEDRIKKSKVPKGTVKEYWSGQERRQFLRVDTSLEVRYSVVKNPNIKLDGQMKNISSNGIKLLVNEKLIEGMLLLLEFTLPDTKEPIDAEGKVVWADGEFDERDEIGRRIFQTGIQFTSIRPNDKNRLIAYIKKVEEEV